jgi:hypothetical protein
VLNNKTEAVELVLHLDLDLNGPIVHCSGATDKVRGRERQRQGQRQREREEDGELDGEESAFRTTTTAAANFTSDGGGDGDVVILRRDRKWARWRLARHTSCALISSQCSRGFGTFLRPRWV